MTHLASSLLGIAVSAVIILTLHLLERRACRRSAPPKPGKPSWRGPFKAGDFSNHRKE